MEESKQKEMKEQVNALYSAYGEYAIKFEHLCFKMRECLIFLLHIDGLRNHQFARILLSNLSADQLRIKLLSSVLELFELPLDAKRTLNQIFSRIQKSIEIRNNIIHSMWFIEWRNSEDDMFDVARGFKDVSTKVGGKAKVFNFNVEEFERNTQEIMFLIDKLGFIYMIASGCNVEKNLDKFSSGLNC